MIFQIFFVMKRFSTQSFFSRITFLHKMLVFGVHENYFREIIQRHSLHTKNTKITSGQHYLVLWLKNE